MRGDWQDLMAISDECTEAARTAANPDDRLVCLEIAAKFAMHAFRESRRAA